jgi:methylenetetrahydrofolate dehydrogenase (NADP+)/methenyltetrahydrofolate cyclohydrolase
MTDARVIDGKAIAAELRADVARRTAALTAAHGIVPGLATVLVGDDPASAVYVRGKVRQADEAGIRGVTLTLPEATTEAELVARVQALNDDPETHGILIQLPLPDHIDADAVIDAIDPDKDVDGFHAINAGRLTIGQPGFVPCTPVGCMLLIDSALDDLTGLDAVVVGRSNIVGKPLAQLLLRRHCTVTVAHSKTRDLPEVCRRADILVAAVGRPHMIEGGWIKPGAVVIDVGINRLPGAEEGKTRLIGDVDFEAARHVAGAITPVPGGVGPMTIACLLRNTLEAACRINGVEVPNPGNAG